jgi:uncharacterized protein YkwD
MHSVGARRVLVGAGLAVAIAGASFSAVLFSGGDSTPAKRVVATRAEPTTSTSTTSTTTTTTTTTLPPLNFEPAPEPAPQAAPAPEPAPAPLNFAPEPAPEPRGCGGGGGVIGAHNGDRAAAGLAGLCENGQLAGFAQGWAEHMAATGVLVHQDIGSTINGTSFFTMGENILVGPAGYSPDQMETAWMNSPTHRANILSGAFTQAGVGTAYSADGRMWVCVDFGG